MEVSRLKCVAPINYMEHVEIYLNATFCVRGFLRLEVESPSGTRSVVKLLTCSLDCHTLNLETMLHI